MDMGGRWFDNVQILVERLGKWDSVAEAVVAATHRPSQRPTTVSIENSVTVLRLVEEVSGFGRWRVFSKRCPTDKSRWNCPTSESDWKRPSYEYRERNANRVSLWVEAGPSVGALPREIAPPEGAVAIVRNAHTPAQGAILWEFYVRCLGAGWRLSVRGCSLSRVCVRSRECAGNVHGTRALELYVGTLDRYQMSGNEKNLEFRRKKRKRACAVCRTQVYTAAELAASPSPGAFFAQLECEFAQECAKYGATSSVRCLPHEPVRQAARSRQHF